MCRFSRRIILGFHGAFGQAKMLPLFTAQLGLPAESMPEAAAGILEAWQRAGSDSGALEYMVEKIGELEQDGGANSVPLRSTE